MRVMTRRNRHHENLLDRIPKHLRWRFNEQLMRLPVEPVSTGTGRIWGIRIPNWMDRRWILYLLGCVPYFPLAIGAFFLVRWQQAHPSALVASPSMSLALVIGMFFAGALIGNLRHLGAPTENRRDWRALNLIGIRTCERCGYDCRATESELCPECGSSLEQAAAYSPEEAHP